MLHWFLDAYFFFLDYYTSFYNYLGMIFYNWASYTLRSGMLQWFLTASLFFLGFIYLFLLTTGSPTLFARVCYTDFGMLTSSFVINILVFTNGWLCYTDFWRLTSSFGIHILSLKIFRSLCSAMMTSNFNCVSSPDWATIRVTSNYT